MDSVLGTSTLWPYCYVPSLILCFMGFLLFSWIKESPAYLAHGPPKSREASSAALEFYHGTISDQATASTESTELPHSSVKDVFRLAFSRVYRRPIGVSVAMGVAFALTSAVLLSYSTAIFEVAGFSDTVAQQATVALEVLHITNTDKEREIMTRDI